MKKIKSSALLISLILGVVLSGILVGIVLYVGQQAESSAQAREGSIAYRASLSGIDDGLLRYKSASSQGKVHELFSEKQNVILSEGDSEMVDINYDISFKMDSLSVGDNLGGNAEILSWEDDADEAVDQGAIPLLSDNFIDIDLTYLANNGGIGSVMIFYSNPFYKNSEGDYDLIPSNPLSAVNVKLLDISKKGEQQMIFEKTNNSSALNRIQVDQVDSCTGAYSSGIPTKNCHLQIKPQVAFVNNPVDEASNRLTGGGLVSISEKYIFFKIRATDSSGNIIEPTGDMPGNITLESVGYAGEAVRKLQAKIDAGSGNYVGLLDFGVYCGDKCEMPSVRGTGE